MKRWLLTLAVLVVTMVAWQGKAQAQWCWFDSTPVSFGVYDVFDPTPLASTGSVTYTCWFAQGMTIWLSKGSAPTNNPRRMSSGISTLNYNLYLDPAHTQIWGDPNPNAYQSTAALFWGSRTVTVYGLIPSGQDVPTGTYTDTIVVTFQY